MAYESAVAINDRNFETTHQNKNLLILHDPNPACTLPITWTQPHIVSIRESDFEGTMRTETIWIGELGGKPTAKLA